MTDAFGEPLEVGDFVGYVSGGRYQDSFKGHILKFGKTRFQIEITHYRGGSGIYLVGETRWLEPHRATKTLETFKNPVTFRVVDHNGNEEVL